MSKELGLIEAHLDALVEGVHEAAQRLLYSVAVPESKSVTVNLP